MSISSLHDRFQSINSQQNLKGNIKYISYPRQTNGKHQNLLKLYNSQLSTTNCVTSCEIHKIKHEMRISNTGTFFSERETCIELHYRILHQHIYTEIKGRPFCRQYLNMHFLQRLLLCFLACSRACASKVFSLRADCGRVIVYPGLKQWERPRHNIFGVCTRLAGGVCMSTSANSSASKHLTVTKIVWKIVYVTFDYLISHFFKILSLEFMANLFRDFRASVSLKVFHYRLRGKWCQYDLEIN